MRKYGQPLFLVHLSAENVNLADKTWATDFSAKSSFHCITNLSKVAFWDGYRWLLESGRDKVKAFIPKSNCAPIYKSQDRLAYVHVLAAKCTALTDVYPVWNP